MSAQIFRIERGLDQRWYVSHIGSKTRSFPTQVEAEEFARRCARMNQPGIVQVAINGQVENEWTFEDRGARYLVLGGHRESI